MPTLTHLECGRCRKAADAAAVASRCPCGGELLARYDLEAIRRSWSREWLGHAPATMWRYAPLLPVANPNSIVSLGEGMTPLVRARRLGAALGLKDLWIKDEGVNPAGSVEARGFSCAVSMAAEGGIREVSLSAAGDAACALAAYAAAAGVHAAIGFPRGVSQTSYVECLACGATVSPGAPAGGGGPYHLEGVKTVGCEIAEQFRWELPGAILAPAGGILPAMEKAFDELEALTWISSKRPRLVAVEPGSLHEMLEAGLELARTEGILPSPEGGACLAALRRLAAEGALDPEDRIVLLNPASGRQYAELYATRIRPTSLTEQDKLGGLITPR